MQGGTYYIMFTVNLFFMFLRAVGFCLDKIDYDKKLKEAEDKEKIAGDKEYPYTLKNLTLYCAYSSFLFTSPFVPFDNFKITFV